MCMWLQVHDLRLLLYDTYILDHVYLTEFVINGNKCFDLIWTQKVVVREVAGRDGIGARSMQAAGNFPSLNYAF